MVGAIYCWLVGWSTGGCWSYSVHSCARAWPELRRARCHAVPFRNPRVRSIQFRICMDMPLAVVAASIGCRAQYVVHLRVLLVNVANLTCMGRNRRLCCCVLRPVVLAAQLGGRSRCAAYAVRSDRQDGCWRSPDVTGYLAVRLGRPRMERFARSIPTARDRFIGVFTPRTRAGLRDFAASGHGAWQVLVCRILFVAFIITALPATTRGLRRGLSLGDDRAVGHQATSNNAARKNRGAKRRCYGLTHNQTRLVECWLSVRFHVHRPSLVGRVMPFA